MRRNGLLMACLALLAVSLLAGCASPGGAQTGTSQADLLARFGAPAAVHRTASGTRLEYIEGPFQQTAWMLDIDPSGRLVGTRQVRSAEGFSRIVVGTDTMQTVRTKIGTPWLVQRYAASGLTAWMYPYLEFGHWNAMMAVHFDDRGLVTLVQNGPDPRFLGGGNRDD